MNLKTFKHLSALFCCALLFIQCNSADQRQLHIEGQLTGVKDSLVFALEGFSHGKIVMKDTVIPTRNGAFELTLPLDSAFGLEIIDAYSRRQGNDIALYTMAVPGEKLVLSGDIHTGCNFGGSSFYCQFNEVAKIVEPFNKKLYKLADDYNKQIKENKLTEAVADKYLKRTTELYQQRQKAIFAFAESHPDNEAMPAFIRYVDMDDAKEFIQNLSPKVQNGILKSYFQPLIFAPKIPVGQGESEE